MVTTSILAAVMVLTTSPPNISTPGTSERLKKSANAHRRALQLVADWFAGRSGSNRPQIHTANRVPPSSSPKKRIIAAYSIGCQKGFSRACLKLAKRYHVRSLEIPAPSRQRLLKTLTASCKNSQSGCRSLALLYRRGVGLKHNPAIACKHYLMKRPGSSQYPKAYIKACTTWLTHGRTPVPVSTRNKAVAPKERTLSQLLQTACGVGDIFACSVLFTLYIRLISSRQMRTTRVLVPPDIRKMESLCTRGDSHSCLSAAAAYELGVGTKKNKAKADELRKRARGLKAPRLLPTQKLLSDVNSFAGS